MENLHIINGLKRKDKKRTERILEVGDNVYLKHQSYKRTSVALRKNLKLASRYYRSYLVEDKIDKIGSIANELKLPEIHPVFHTSLLERENWREGSHLHRLTGKGSRRTTQDLSCLATRYSNREMSQLSHHRATDPVGKFGTKGSNMGGFFGSIGSIGEKGVACLLEMGTDGQPKIYLALVPDTREMSQLSHHATIDPMGKFGTQKKQHGRILLNFRILILGVKNPLKGRV
ncbi:phosphate transporter pho1-like 10 [Gossypium australe]|uniref:Phosphate transporter pho1-like 10 n=1 Tax=Gossypium australe TaxID=47621 RepID=A0A5B6U6R3_9ROSI|nr:phosphate transporter pho1-like 10 [Gossypium australe]